MKKYLVGVIILLFGCQTGAVKPPEKPEQPTPPPVIVEEPVEPKDCSEFERSTTNPAINEWLEKELNECRGLTN